MSINIIAQVKIENKQKSYGIAIKKIDK